MGEFYCLFIEVEWEYVCCVGILICFLFGDDIEELSDYVWFYDNSNEKY